MTHIASDRRPVHVQARGRSSTWRPFAAHLADLSTFAVVIGLFAISPITLEHFGFSYMTAGGSAVSKVHPSTLLACIAIGLRCCSSRRPFRAGWRMMTDDTGVVLFLSATALVIMDAVAVSHTPMTGLIDTFVLPALCFVLIRDLDPVWKKWLAIAVIVLLCVNAVMAIIEFLRGMHFVTVDLPAGASSDPTRSDAVFDWRAELAHEWRATALFGHPLVNGLIVGCAIVCFGAFGADWIPPTIRAAMLLLLGASMFAFGARTSLVLVAAISVILLFQQCVEALRNGARLRPRDIALGLVAFAVLFVGIDLLYESGFLDRTIQRFSEDDGSAGTRLTMLELFDHFSWTDLLLAPDQDVLATWQRLYGLEFGIESSWVGLILTYGLIVTSLLVVGLLSFARSIMKEAGRGSMFVFLFYFISVSSAASLSNKTTSLAMSVCLIILLLPKKDNRRSARGQT